MERNASTPLQRLRSRPAHERRILGAAAYAAASAAVIALWLTSLEKTLQMTPPAGESIPAPIAASNETGSRTTETETQPYASQPISPLAALKEAAETAAAGIREFGSRVGRLNNELAPSDDFLPPAQEEPPSRGREEILPPQSQKEAPPLEGEMPKGRPTAVAETLVRGLKAKQYSTHAISRLASPPLKPVAKLTQESKRASRTMTVISYNFAEILRAAADFYSYLKGN